jgi:hypothetical protein
MANAFPFFSWSTRYLSAIARLVKPRFLGKPFVIGSADQAVGAREEHRTASKAFAIRFDTRRDCASRLRAFDHDDSHLDPPRFWSGFVLAAECQFAGRSE